MEIYTTNYLWSVLERVGARWSGALERVGARWSALWSTLEHNKDFGALTTLRSTIKALEQNFGARWSVPKLPKVLQRMLQSAPKCSKKVLQKTKKCPN